MGDVLRVGHGIQSIDIDDSILRIGLQPVVDEGAANESASPRDEKNLRGVGIDSQRLLLKDLLQCFRRQRNEKRGLIDLPCFRFDQLFRPSFELVRQIFCFDRRRENLRFLVLPLFNPAKGNGAFVTHIQRSTGLAVVRQGQENRQNVGENTHSMPFIAVALPQGLEMTFVQIFISHRREQFHTREKKQRRRFVQIFTHLVRCEKKSIS